MLINNYQEGIYMESITLSHAHYLIYKYNVKAFIVETLLLRKDFVFYTYQLLEDDIHIRTAYNYTVNADASIEIEGVLDHAFVRGTSLIINSNSELDIGRYNEYINCFKFIRTYWSVPSPDKIVELISTALNAE